ncbi:hypothetical protein GGX14DRAFT_565303 [Mycena pura]|uniref:Uncharacterized protein n=1 Tax=Mycena pura TaxID=153505 RepID=A0AAD6VEQ3_9AGAR|nr:hypothetical protein GGX14DRAFT_565303 [Mycena pura]
MRADNETIPEYHDRLLAITEVDEVAALDDDDYNARLVALESRERQTKDAVAAAREARRKAAEAERMRVEVEEKERQKREKEKQRRQEKDKADKAEAARKAKASEKRKAVVKAKRPSSDLLQAFFKDMDGKRKRNVDARHTHCARGGLRQAGKLSITTTNKQKAVPSESDSEGEEFELDDDDEDATLPPIATMSHEKKKAKVVVDSDAEESLEPVLFETKDISEMCRVQEETGLLLKKMGDAISDSLTVQRDIAKAIWALQHAFRSAVPPETRGAGSGKASMDPTDWDSTLSSLAEIVQVIGRGGLIIVGELS